MDALQGAEQVGGANDKDGGKNQGGNLNGICINETIIRSWCAFRSPNKKMES